jgi:hypothetical protein
MKITIVFVSYRELRSKNWTNKCYEVGYEAVIERGESVKQVREKLLEKAKFAVHEQFDEDEVAEDIELI